MSNYEEVTHTLFVDDVLIFGEGSIINIEAFASLIDKYKITTRMVVNMGKSNLIHNEFSADMIHRVREIVPYQITPVEEGFKFFIYFS